MTKLIGYIAKPSHDVVYFTGAFEGAFPKLTKNRAEAQAVPDEAAERQAEYWQHYYQPSVKIQAFAT